MRTGSELHFIPEACNGNLLWQKEAIQT